MRNILLWDQILGQLNAGTYGPAPTYTQPTVDVAAFGADELPDLPVPWRANLDPVADLEVSWTELQHNLTLMLDDGVITAQETARAFSNVRMTEKGRRMFALRDEGERYSRPMRHQVKQAGFGLSRLAFPAFAVIVLAWMVLDAF